jgi:hypothetical protein
MHVLYVTCWIQDLELQIRNVSVSWGFKSKTTLSCCSLALMLICMAYTSVDKVSNAVGHLDTRF